MEKISQSGRPILVVAQELGIKLEDLGTCKKVRIEKDDTTLIEGAGSAEAIEGRIKQTRTQEDPLREIAKNAGKESSVIVERMKEGEGASGYDAQKEEFTDLVQAGIVDPTKVVRCVFRTPPV